MQCNICKREFESFRLLGIHITNSHKITTEKYYLDSGGHRGVCKQCGRSTRFVSIAKGYSRCCGHKCAKILDSKNPEYRKRISDATKMAMAREDVRRNLMEAVSRPKSEETIKKLSNAAKQRYINDPTLKNRIYTKERNKKISDFKFQFWKNNPEEKKRVGNIWKLWKERDENGWRKHLMEASKKGFEKIFSPRGDTSLEIKLYEMLKMEGIKFEKKYEVSGKIFDAYLPDHMTLIEIDGEFWHKPLKECKYKFQIESFYNDRLKEKIAKNNGFKLLRIKEKSIPKTITEIL